MFSGCSSLVQIDMANFCSEKLSDASHMFDGCEKLTSIDMRKFDMSHVENYEGIFEEIPREGNFIGNTSFSEELLRLIPGSWEKVVIKKTQLDIT